MKMEVLSVQSQFQGQFGVMGSAKVKGKSHLLHLSLVTIANHFRTIPNGFYRSICKSKRETQAIRLLSKNDIVCRLARLWVCLCVSLHNQLSAVGHRQNDNCLELEISLVLVIHPTIHRLIKILLLPPQHNPVAFLSKTPQILSVTFISIPTSSFTPELPPKSSSTFIPFIEQTTIIVICFVIFDVPLQYLRY